MSSATEKTFILLLIFMGILVSGCSANRRPIENMPVRSISPGFSISGDAYWWRCKFKNVWPEGTEPDLVIDLLLAHAVVAPVLAEHSNEIPYWRFHRRAHRDLAGHQFSFLFYSKAEIAYAVFKEIHQSDVLKRVMTANLVEKVIVDDPSHPQFPSIEDTSDPRWSLNLQKNWPSFIMGVSALWLGLIDDSVQYSPHDFQDAGKLLEKYREAGAAITNTWKTEGQHALLHHLNAVFGYEPMRIYKELSF